MECAGWPDRRAAGTRFQSGGEPPQSKETVPGSCAVVVCVHRKGLKGRCIAARLIGPGGVSGASAWIPAFAPREPS